MKGIPLNTMPDGNCRTIKGQYHFTSTVNLMRQGTFGASGAVEILNMEDKTMDNEEFIKKLRIRKLTPEECFELMGMTKEDCIKARELGVSNSQLYKIAGNGLISNCVQLLMEHLYKATEDPEYVCWDEQMVADGYGV